MRLFFFERAGVRRCHFLYLSPYCISLHMHYNTGFYIRNTLYCEGSYGDFLPAFSSLLSFRPSVASCCCHCSCFQQQHLLQAAIAMDDATGILLHSLKRPILHSAWSRDQTVKRHEPYKYMWLLWVSSDIKHHPQRLLATRNRSSYVGRQVPFGADFWLWSAASREQYSPSTKIVAF